VSSAGRQLAAWDHATSIKEVLENLPRIAAAGAQLEQHLTGRVRKARELGATWARIGESLGMTRQPAWDRGPRARRRLRPGR
jgi:hypothetical protein